MILLIEVTLKINVRMCFGQFFLSGDDIDVEVVQAESLLKLIVGGVGRSFAVDLERLDLIQQMDTSWHTHRVD